MRLSRRWCDMETTGVGTEEVWTIVWTASSADVPKRRAATVRLANPKAFSITGTIFDCNQANMNDDGTQTGQLAVLPAQCLSGATSTDQQTDAVDDTKIAVHDGLNSNTGAPQVLVVCNHDDNKMPESATAAASSRPRDEKDAA